MNAINWLRSIVSELFNAKTPQKTDRRENEAVQIQIVITL